MYAAQFRRAATEWWAGISGIIGLHWSEVRHLEGVQIQAGPVSQFDLDLDLACSH